MSAPHPHSAHRRANHPRFLLLLRLHHPVLHPCHYPPAVPPVRHPRRVRVFRRRVPRVRHPVSAQAFHQALRFPLRRLRVRRYRRHLPSHRAVRRLPRLAHRHRKVRVVVNHRVSRHHHRSPSVSHLAPQNPHPSPRRSPPVLQSQSASVLHPAPHHQPVRQSICRISCVLTSTCASQLRLSLPASP